MRLQDRCFVGQEVFSSDHTSCFEEGEERTLCGSAEVVTGDPKLAIWRTFIALRNVSDELLG